MRTNKSHIPKLLLVISLLVVSLHPGNASSFVTTINPKSEECFEFRTPVDKTTIVTGSFDCLDDEMVEGMLSVKISNQGTGDVLYRSPKLALEGSFDLLNLDASTRLQICFSNKYAVEREYDNSFDLGFSIRVSNPPRGLDDGVIGPDAQRALSLVEKAAEIHKDWELMKDHQEFTRNREAIHDEMSETILGRLVRWAFLETFLVIGMACAQVMYWKRFFETKRYL